MTEQASQQDSACLSSSDLQHPILQSNGIPSRPSSYDSRRRVVRNKYAKVHASVKANVARLEREDVGK